MLLSTFITRTLAYASVDGSPFLDSDADRQVFIGEKLQEFTVKCPCLYFDDISMTITAGTRLYSFDDYSTVFTRSGTASMALVEPVNMWVNGASLMDFKGDPGPIGSEEVEDWLLDITATGSIPSKWGIHAPDRIFLHPSPTTVPTIRLAAWAQHPQVTSSTTASSTSISIPTSRVGAAVKYAAALLLDPLAAGDGKDRANQILKEALYEMDEFRQKMESYRRSRGPRGVRYTGGLRLDN